MLQKHGNLLIDKVLESDDEEKEVKQRLKEDNIPDAQLDLQLAEHRAKNIVSELGLDKAREGTEVYKGSS